MNIIKNTIMMKIDRKTHIKILILKKTERKAMIKNMIMKKMGRKVQFKKIGSIVLIKKTILNMMKKKDPFNNTILKKM